MIRSRTRTGINPKNAVLLELETLERRDCPTGPGTTTMPPPGMSPPQSAPGVPQPLAPSISLAISYGSQRSVTLAGQVTGGAPGGAITVTFTGVVAGSTTANSDGSFRYTAQASGLGKVSARATNSQGQDSNVVEVDVKSLVPTISMFDAVQGVNNIWTFTGRVTDESAAGLIVAFGGLQGLTGKTATVGSDGSFTITVQLDATDTGIATAQTIDWWSLNSNVAWDLV